MGQIYSMVTDLIIYLVLKQLRNLSIARHSSSSFQSRMYPGLQSMQKIKKKRKQKSWKVEMSACISETETDTETETQTEAEAEAVKATLTVA